MTAAPTHVTLGFARGIAPAKWERRHAAAFPGRRLELLPIDTAYGPAPDDVDVMLQRTLPGAYPEGVEHGSRRAIRLYVEALGVVVPIDHELAESGTVDIADLPLIPLLDHPWHAREWPVTEPWVDPSLMPQSLSAAFDLVATGLGALLAPRTLARHLGNRREHTILTLTGDHAPEGTTVWATWESSGDGDEVQDLIGILRGRTARSSRAQSAASSAASRSSSSTNAGTNAKPNQNSRSTAAQPKLPANSRGAQLAAARKRKRPKR